MKISELSKTLSSYKKLFGSIESHQLDYFLKSHLPSHYEAKKRLELGWADWDALKKYSQVAKYYDDHAFYSMAVANVCRIENPFPIKKADFVGSGAGKYTLDSYRKVQLEDGRVLFEKVYKNGSDDLERLNFFIGYGYPSVIKKFKVPHASLLEGERGSVAYFDWLDRVVSVDKKNILLFYRDFRRALLDINVCPRKCPEVIFDFERESLYNSGLKSARSFLSRAGLRHEASLLVEGTQYLLSLPFEEKVFCHGDLSPPNILQGEIVIDFDRCGVYPDGYDLAFLCSKFKHFDSVSELSSCLAMEMEEFSDFGRLSFFFFAFLFYSRAIGVKSSDTFLLELWEAFSSRAKEAGIGL